jgi:hypothetical protein
MKTTLLFLLAVICSLTVSGQTSRESEIEAALDASFASRQNRVEPILTTLKKDAAANAYWIAYASMYSAVYEMQTGKSDVASAILTDGIKTLEKLQNKSSEDLALLGYMTSFSISLDPSAAMRLSAKANKYYEEALKKDNRNLRVYLGLGEADFYKPVQYGGGQKVEEYLMKAISLPDQSSSNGPAWGKNSAYHTLASYYLREGNKDKAKLFCMQGLGRFPKDYRLNQLKQSL